MFPGRPGFDGDLGPPRCGGQLHLAYANPRPEVTALVPVRARTVLDVGCSVGVMGAALRERGCRVVGIEHDPALAAEAGAVLQRVVVGDVEEMAACRDDLGGETFDCVVLADVLEHLRDPWSVTRWSTTLLNDAGSLVVSVPNIRHARTFHALLVQRRWPYEPVGIFDRSHLRWFARRNLPDLLHGTGFTIVELRRSQLLHLNPASRWNRLAPLLGDLSTLQFIFRAEKDERP